MKCRAYDADCINPAYCTERDACCAGDPECRAVIELNDLDHARSVADMRTPTKPNEKLIALFSTKKDG